MLEGLRKGLGDLIRKEKGLVTITDKRYGRSFVWRLNNGIRKFR